MTRYYSGRRNGWLILEQLSVAELSAEILWWREHHDFIRGEYEKQLDIRHHAFQVILNQTKTILKTMK